MESASIIGLERIAESGNWWLQIELPRDVEKYTVYKGSLCIEGISLYSGETRQEQAASLPSFPTLLKKLT